MATLFTLNVSQLVGTDEYTPMLYDLSRMLSMQFMYQVMMVLTRPDEFSIMQEEYMEYILYISLGILLYWLVFRKFVQIV